MQPQHVKSMPSTVHDGMEQSAFSARRSLWKEGAHCHLGFMTALIAQSFSPYPAIRARTFSISVFDSSGGVPI
jgi:hypothetical protein